MTEMGIFVVPSAEHPELTVDQVLAADAAGLDSVAVQDHPYQVVLAVAVDHRRLGDAWLPSLGGRYLQPDDVAPMQIAIDDAAHAAGRDPSAIRRAVNVMELEGDPSSWAARLAAIVTELRFETLLIGTPPDDPVGFVRWLGEEIAPEVRSRTGD